MALADVLLNSCSALDVGSNTVVATIAPLTPEERLDFHSDGHICLLEDMQVLTVHDVPDAGNNVSVLLVDLEHLTCDFLRGVTEHRHLQGDRVDLFDVLLDLLDSTGQYLISIVVDAHRELRGVISKRDPCVPVSIDTELLSK